MTLPADVAATLEAVCAQYPGPVTDDRVFGEVLNRVAWIHRADGWGLSRKTGGRHVESPAGPIAEDVLHHRPSNLHWDVFTAAGIGRPLQPARAGSAPIGPVTDPNRPWVAPVQPLVTAPTPIPPTPTYPPPTPPTPVPPVPDGRLDEIADTLATLLEQVALVSGQINGLSDAMHALFSAQNVEHLDAIKQQIAALPASGTVCRFPKIRGVS